MIRKHSIRVSVALLALFLLGALSGAGSASADIDLESFEYATTESGGAPSQQAGAHPDEVTARFNFAEDPTTHLPFEQPRNLSVDLPLGAVGDPTATPLCSDEQLVQNECPNEAQVGIILLRAPSVFAIPIQYPVYNVKAPPGILAEFGFNILGVTPHLVATIHSQPDYGVTITLRNLPASIAYTEATNVFWGVPADPSHNDSRGSCLGLFGPTGGECTSDPPAVLPFLSNPTACSGTSIAHARANSWQSPVYAAGADGNTDELGEPIGITGCDELEFEPQIEARPTTPVADSPTGLEVGIHVPQNSEPDELNTSQLRDAVLNLPAGLTVNPSSAAGLDGCSPSQVGLTSGVGNSVAHFDESSPACPAASKLGTVEIATPVIAQPLTGSIYLAQPHQNPFGSLLGLYIVVQDPATGAIIKLAGRPEPDPQTGRLTVSFRQNPQLPFEDLNVSLYPGARAALRTPLSCGQYKVGSTLTPWTSPAGADRHPSDAFSVTTAPGSGACPASDEAAPSAPTFESGTKNPTARIFSPFVLEVERADGTQPFKGLDVTLPKGLLGKLAGVPYCSDGDLAAAASKSGKAEQASPSCPAASQVGSVEVGAGAGTTPLYVPGKAYLAGPYKGAPLSLAIVTPAVAGPFDLGTVVVRSALDLDPATTQIHVVSDPIPSILQGIPLDIRSIAVNIDRPDFTLNPTNCEPTQIGGSVLSVFDQSTPVSSPFAVGGCRALEFKPRLSLAFKGKTRRTGNPALIATLRAPRGQANIAKTTVILPKPEFIDNAHINNPCTRVQFNQDACPATSILGTATAYTPLLDRPLRGPVYFRSNGGERELPDLVADLNGQIHVILVGYIDSVDERVRTRFANVPDAPVSKFVLRMKGGRKGLLANSRNLCNSTNRAAVRFDGQNGKIRDFSTVVTNDCKARKHKHKPHRHKR
jgi:hypothetical protein